MNVCATERGWRKGCKSFVQAVYATLKLGQPYPGCENAEKHSNESVPGAEDVFSRAARSVYGLLDGILSENVRC